MSLIHAYTLSSPAGARGIVPSAIVGGARPRIDSIDVLRGLVLIVMALDHTRDFFGASGMNPRDVADAPLFLTRWITHFCAPIFILLAGISAWLYGARGRTTGDISRFLLTRGLWLMAIELTVVRFGWMFALDSRLFLFGVIFAIGAAMVALAVLVHLPRWAIAAIGVTLIAGHNLFDGVRPADLGAFGWAWSILHVPSMLAADNGVRLYTAYPLLPWIGVMALGYVLGPLFKADRRLRVQWLAMLGVAVTVGFVLLRACNLYGDPKPWIAHDSALATVLSFVNCEKYPPSLLYLMMTLGPALLLLAAFEAARGAIADMVITFGRVPFAYYIVHIYLLHTLAIAYVWSTGGDASFLLGNFPAGKPPGYGPSLPGIYAIWLMVVLALYPLCRWFAALKQRRGDWWLSYL